MELQPGDYQNLTWEPPCGGTAPHRYSHLTRHRLGKVVAVVGGQYGSEGKGKLVAHLAGTCATSLSAVRCGGTNSGHTIDSVDGPLVLRQLPSASLVKRARLFLAAGMIMDLPLLARECARAGVDVSRLRIDRNAVILEDGDAARERSVALGDRISSTLSGSGAALARKIMRDASQLRAGQIEELRDNVTVVSHELADRLRQGDTVLVEGTQGFGLSLHHSDHFPFVTSRDTSAAAFLSEAGLPPTAVSDVIVVLRTFPIRVGGNSGPLPREVSWDSVTRGSGYPRPLAEFTSVTGRLRRVAEFDWEVVEAAVEVNGATGLALHGADYLAFSDFGKSQFEELSLRTRLFVDALEDRLHVPVQFVFTGPGATHIVDRREPIPLAGAPALEAAATGRSLSRHPMFTSGGR